MSVGGIRMLRGSPRLGGIPGGPWKSGNKYYGVAATGVGLISNPTGNFDFLPFDVAIAVPLSGLWCEVTTGFAATVTRMGIYRDVGGDPSILVADAGTVDSSTTGIKEFALASLVLNPGYYWICCGPQGGTIAYRSVGGNSLTPRVYGFNPTDLSPSRTNSLVKSGIAGALPDPLGAISNAGSSGIGMGVKTV